MNDMERRFFGHMIPGFDFFFSFYFPPHLQLLLNEQLFAAFGRFGEEDHGTSGMRGKGRTTTNLKPC